VAGAAASAAAAAGTDRLATLFERKGRMPEKALRPFLFSGGFLENCFLDGQALR
jgi:hypothetical protein